MTNTEKRLVRAEAILTAYLSDKPEDAHALMHIYMETYPALALNAFSEEELEENYNEFLSGAFNEQKNN